MGTDDIKSIAATRRVIAGAKRVAVRFAAPGISLAVLFGALLELRALDWRAVLAMVPHDPRFWLVFVVAYATPILCDWTIYRRIWAMPVGGIAVLARKLIGNELLMGFVGEAYLLAWAQREGHRGRAAFGAVKDVSILSAAVGNGLTILVALAAVPFVAVLHLPETVRAVPWWVVAASLGAILTPPLVAVLLRGKLFGLPGADLRAIVAIHGVRATATVGLTALLWHLALPAVALSWWLVFSALKLVLSRLPFVSNKEVVFAGVVVILLGRHADVPALMTMMATAMVAMHVAVGAVLGIVGVVEGARPALRRAAIDRRPATA